ncbi:MAG: signal peptidase I [Thermomicrobiales bacterium]
MTYEETRVDSSNVQSDGPAADGLAQDEYSGTFGQPDPALETSPPAKVSSGKFTREVIETIVLAVLIFFGVRLIVLNFQVDGSSMVPNLHNGEMLLVNRNVYMHFDVNQFVDWLPAVDHESKHVVYPFHPPQRGDIIVFNPPTNSDKPYIKRVIGLPGETVSFKGGYVYIDGEKLDEPYINGAITKCNRQVCEDVKVPNGDIFVMGDNRENSADSRSFGPVSVDSIIGKAWVTYWPFDDFGLVPHYDYPGISG